MSVRVDELSTEVTAEAAPTTGAESGAQAMEWQEQEKAAAAAMRLLRDGLRTRAHGFDD
ncbi:MAG TPA: hypothetical protein VF746_25870 [Longimicrobium sp.]|jgi:hypothetical protein